LPCLTILRPRSRVGRFRKGDRRRLRTLERRVYIITTLRLRDSGSLARAIWASGVSQPSPQGVGLRRLRVSTDSQQLTATLRGSSYPMRSSAPSGLPGPVGLFGGGRGCRACRTAPPTRNPRLASAGRGRDASRTSSATISRSKAESGCRRQIWIPTPSLRGSNGLAVTSLFGRAARGRRSSDYVRGDALIIVTSHGDHLDSDALTGNAPPGSASTRLAFCVCDPGGRPPPRRPKKSRSPDQRAAEPRAGLLAD